MNVDGIKFNRREFCALGGVAITSLAIDNACSGVSGLGFPNDGRLSARPRTDVKTAVTGEVKLGVNSERDAVLHVPKSAGQSPLPLLVLLHGATQSSETMFRYLGSTPEEAGVVVLAPNSRDTTWDAIRNTFADDVNDLNRALERTFERVAIDPTRVALGGFSDGASYAISLGLINGDLFNSVIAFSPGFVIDGEGHGKPRFFISHGTHDHILPIDRCGRRIAAELKARGYEVNFREFDGDHEIPADVAREGLKFISKER
jgi:phospholipase/carboxylesterase